MKFDGSEVDPQRLLAMRDSMTHRGPDDAGIHVEGPIGLAHRRLSIMDLTAAGRQPLSNEDRSVWVVVNGEIYNSAELTRELVRKGHHFGSSSDSEVLVHLYEEEGIDCVRRLNGMFAFVIWDKKRRKFFGARDRCGVKPYFYYSGADQFIAASEVKAIFADRSIPRAPDHSGLADFMFSGFMQGEKTVFSGIRQLPAGHIIEVSEAGTKVSKYWDLEYNYNYQRSDADLHHELRALLDDAVRLNCRSDAPLGCHLSGGLDSSTVVSLAARHYRPLKSFSIRFDGHSYFDETRYAKLVAEHVGAEYVEGVPTPQSLSALLPRLINHIESPLPNIGGFSYYTVSRLASEHVKVSLTGHGGDEIFAGYPAQFQAAFGTPGQFGAVAAPPAQPAEPSLFARFRRIWKHEGARGVVSRINRRIRPPTRSFEELWTALHCAHLPATNRALDPAFVKALGGYSPIDDYLAPLREAATDQPLDRCLYHDLRSYLPGLLHMEDRMSMAVSIESRVPLLDHRIVELLATVPPEQKVPQLQPKALLRRVAKELIPEEVYKRTDKRAFPVPVDEWLNGELKGYVKTILQSPRSLDRGVFNADVLRRGELGAGETWSALNIELWFRAFIDGETSIRSRLEAAKQNVVQSLSYIMAASLVI